MKYKKKPIVIEAVQWIGQDFWGDKTKNKILIAEYEKGKIIVCSKKLYIQTLEGRMTASLGDYIIQGVNGEIYPCKPDIFDKTYDKVGEE